MRYLRQLPAWVDIVWCALLAIYILIGVDITPFHGDESTLIYMGRDTYHHFVEGDMSKIYYDDTWTISPSEQQLRLINGTIPKYIYGAVAISTGYQLDQINEQWDWGADYSYNQDTGRIPDPPLLQAGRIASSVQIILATVALFAFTLYILNRPIAYLTSLYFVLNPLILLNSRRAMMEGSHLLGMTLLLVAGLWMIQQERWWHYIIFGMVAGFAVASKHPNAIITGLIFIACFTYHFKRVILTKPSRISDLFNTTLGLFVAGILTIGVFYLLNPAWWQQPIESTRESLTLRSDLLQLQSQTFSSYTSIADRLNGFFEFVFIARPQYYEVEQWATYPAISEQIQTYEQSLWSGFAIGGSTLGGLIVLLLSGLGFVQFNRNADIPLVYRWYVSTLIIGIIVITIILTPLDWARYYLPIVPFVGLMLAYSIYLITHRFWKQNEV